MNQTANIRQSKRAAMVEEFLQFHSFASDSHPYAQEVSKVKYNIKCNNFETTAICWGHPDDDARFYEFFKKVANMVNRDWQRFYLENKVKNRL